MSKNFSKQINYDGKSVLAVIVREVRQDGKYYEINIPEFPRFYMSWSALGRYDIVGDDAKGLPYNLILAVSDTIEEQEKRR